VGGVLGLPLLVWLSPNVARLTAAVWATADNPNATVTKTTKHSIFFTIVLLKVCCEIVGKVDVEFFQSETSTRTLSASHRIAIGIKVK
jgi:hypothetical protein